MNPVRLIAYSDYLCPWCYNAAVRLQRIEDEFGAQVYIEWRSYLLRPRPEPGRSLEKFRAYTESWLRPAADADAGTFRVWQTDEGPPSHSIPPHLVAKAAAAISSAAFRRVHDRLLHVYFAENRDITRDDNLRAIWRDCGLPDADFARRDDPAILQAVLADHNEATELGVNGVPAVRMADTDTAIVGAHPLEMYRRWVAKRLNE